MVRWDELPNQRIVWGDADSGGRSNLVDGWGWDLRIRIREVGRIWWWGEDRIWWCFKHFWCWWFGSPHCSTLAATESACCLVSMTGNPMVLSIWCWFFSAVPTAQALAGIRICCVSPPNLGDAMLWSEFGDGDIWARRHKVRFYQDVDATNRRGWGIKQASPAVEKTSFTAGT